MIANNADGVQGEAIADVFANKYNGLYNSVSYDDGEMSILKKDIDVMIHSCYDHSTDVRIPVISVQGVALAVGEMKTGKRDANHMLFTDHLVHGTNRLFVMLSLFFTSAVVHGCIPSEINTSTLVPIPKNTKKSLNDSDNYRAIALSSIFGKLFDKIILKKYYSVFITTDQQFWLGGVIEHVSDYSHLGYIIGSECDSLNIQCCISHFYAKLNVLFRDLYYVSFDIKYLLMKTYCMSLYGCPLWELDGKNIEKCYVAWRKGIRRLLGLPYKIQDSRFKTYLFDP